MEKTKSANKKSTKIRADIATGSLNAISEMIYCYDNNLPYSKWAESHLIEKLKQFMDSQFSMLKEAGKGKTLDEVFGFSGMVGQDPPLELVIMKKRDWGIGLKMFVLSTMFGFTISQAIELMLTLNARDDFKISSADDRVNGKMGTLMEFGTPLDQVAEILFYSNKNNPPRIVYGLPAHLMFDLSEESLRRIYRCHRSQFIQIKDKVVNLPDDLKRGILRQLRLLAKEKRLSEKTRTYIVNLTRTKIQKS
ncbi:MAG: hypothetical protein ABSB32_10270 [Thermodesulfobacteriota bacterium]|jgi:hypothetical protein